MDKNDSKPGQQGGCPVLAFQRMVSGKYKIRILWDLKDGARRYGEIRSGLLRGGDGSGEIAPRVLSRELKALAAVRPDPAQGLRHGAAQGRIPPDAGGQELRAGDRCHPQMGPSAPDRRLARRGGRLLLRN